MRSFDSDLVKAVSLCMPYLGFCLFLQVLQFKDSYLRESFHVTLKEAFEGSITPQALFEKERDIKKTAYTHGNRQKLLDEFFRNVVVFVSHWLQWFFHLIPQIYA